MPTGAQIRMARAAVRLSVRELAAEARVSPTTITRVETDGSSNASTLAALERALEAAGVEFLPDNGVRLKVIQLEHPLGAIPGPQPSRPEPKLHHGPRNRPPNRRPSRRHRA